MAAKWMETLGSRKPKTRESYESIVNRHLLPHFASMPIASIDYPSVLAFVATLQRQGLGAGTVRNIRDVLRLVLVVPSAVDRGPPSRFEGWRLASRVGVPPQKEVAGPARRAG